MNDVQQSPRLITWSGYLAITFLLVIPISVLMVRSGAWQQGLLLYALACLGSLLLVLLSIVLLLLPKFADFRGKIGKGMLAALPGALLLLSLGATRGDYPGIHDITTDTLDPPTFTAAPAQRGEGSNPLDIKPDSIEQQKQAYPGIQTIRSSLPIDDAFDKALATAQAMHWEIYHQDKNAGVIEAVATTGIMAFKDDVVIRVRSDAQGTKVDLRSVSRVGVGDIGANALRIRAYTKAFNGAN